ncbi:acyl-CoA dehydrogenase family protein [Streptomyces sp. BE147]|uniref:acyl-CoA dehydrogenase family protein n=1 Tax=unclassified Streptomyces TaxID=2593676 RepID=UPI002E77761E|nr:acyl-CoA dehydrogenase family protein [Streptomyces sp. BE147]MEE1736343.1 acyl-CoA/acyl-ACP dehydrogenase [Streptomyces sp. BE147]
MRGAPGEGTVLATPPDLAAEPLVLAVTRVAVDVLRPVAERTAEEGVPRSHLDALARCGAHGLVSYEPAPGSGVSRNRVTREVHEILSAVDPSTWFVFVQHYALVKALVRSGETTPAARWLPALLTGGKLATAGFAYLRHPRPPVTAEQVDGGWLLRGRVPWMTGWGLADMAIIGAVTPDDRALFVRADCVPGSGLVRVPSRELWAMRGTHTAAVELRDVLVPPQDVISIGPRSDWSRDYDLENANCHPAVLGHIRAAVDLLLGAAPRAGATFGTLAHRLAEEAARLRAESYALRDEYAPEEEVEARIENRAAILDLGVRAATACVAATGGRAVQFGDTAGRLAREAQFHLIQAQTSQLREAVARRTLKSL